MSKISDVRRHRLTQLGVVEDKQVIETSVRTDFTQRWAMALARGDRKGVRTCLI